jgi:DNA-binding transcriptional regulator PaaX
VQQSGVKGSEATFKTAVKEMVDAGDIFSKKGTKNSTLYSLKPFGADDG